MPATTATALAVQRRRLADQVQRLQGAHHKALVSEDLAPGKSSQDEAAEERGHDKHQQHVAPAADLEGDGVRERVRDREREHRGDPREQE
jgi:hypothetical protein